MPELIAFDVNETLLSLGLLRERFVATYRGDVDLGEWFARLLHGSMLANALDAYRPFELIGAEVLVALAGRSGRDITLEEAKEAVLPMSVAPPHFDVVPAMELLASKGQRMIALTNGSTEMANSQIENAGLADVLERVISVEEVGRFKPDPIVYQYAAEQMGVPIGSMALVAAHDWDCAGAMHAGAAAVFVRRPGITWNLPTPPPTQVVGDIAELAQSVS